MRKKSAFLLVLLLGLVTLAGCGTPAKPDGLIVEAQGPGKAGETIPPAANRANANSVIAEGVVEPARVSYLSFEIPGDASTILVEAGDRVAAGTAMVQLDNRELVLALRSAEQDVVAQEAALRQLLHGASDQVVARADKGNADQIAQAEVALRAKQLQLEIAQAEDPSIGVAAAQASVRQLELALAQARAQDPNPSVTAASVALEKARIVLEDTQDGYSQALDRPWEDQAIRDSWAKRLELVQLDHTAAQAQLDSALNTQRAHTIGLDILAAQVQEAQTQFAQALVAQDTFSTTLSILAADVEAARLYLEALESWDNPYRDEASSEQIAQAQAMLEKAQIAVARLKLQMEDTELTAPFAGTVVDVQIEVGDRVNPGQVVVVLATLEQLEIHTTDLTELEVGVVALAQPATVTVDALPGLELAGTVQEIALQGQNYRGDTVYGVTVKIDDPGQVTTLRWGMTTVVEIVGD